MSNRLVPFSQAVFVPSALLRWVKKVKIWPEIPREGLTSVSCRSPEDWLRQSSLRHILQCRKFMYLRESQLLKSSKQTNGRINVLRGWDMGLLSVGPGTAWCTIEVCLIILGDSLVLQVSFVLKNACRGFTGTGTNFKTPHNRFHWFIYVLSSLQNF